MTHSIYVELKALASQAIQETGKTFCKLDISDYAMLQNIYFDILEILKEERKVFRICALNTDTDLVEWYNIPMVNITSVDLFKIIFLNRVAYASLQDIKRAVKV